MITMDDHGPSMIGFLLSIWLSLPASVPRASDASPDGEVRAGSGGLQKKGCLHLFIQASH